RCDGRVDVVVVGAAECRLEGTTRPVEEERRADALERAGDAEGHVALPAGWLDRGRLVQARGVQKEREGERDERGDDRRAGRVPPPSACPGAGRGPTSRCLLRLHQNWK